MSLMSELLKESASAGATSAGGVAGHKSSLFGGDSGRKDNQTTVLRRMGFVEVSELPSIRKKKPVKRLFNSMRPISEGDETTSGASVKPFDYQDVLSKLDQAVKTAGERKENVAVFGLEDDEGKIVKVYVDKEESQKFEDALAIMLADNDTVFADEDEPKTGQEIAEILYKLKDQFNIRDIEWGTIEGDEEEETEVTGDEVDGMEQESDAAEDAEGGEGGEMGEEGLEGEDGETDELEAEAMGDAGGGEEAASSALQSVIDMMKADSSARQAEAEARKSEADAIIAKNANAAAQAKVAKEEDLLDMQTAEKAKKDAKKEAETLAKLAKYKKEVGSAGDDVEIDGEDGAEDFNPDDDGPDEDAADPDLDFDITPNEENEEESAPEKEMTKEQLARLILKYAQAN